MNQAGHGDVLLLGSNHEIYPRVLYFKKLVWNVHTTTQELASVIEDGKGIERDGYETGQRTTAQ
jgi:hypothetical protein